MIFKSIEKRIADLNYVKTVDCFEIVTYKKTIWIEEDEYTTIEVSIRPGSGVITFNSMVSVSELFSHSETDISRKELKLFCKLAKKLERRNKRWERALKK